MKRTSSKGESISQPAAAPAESNRKVLRPPAEVQYAEELQALSAADREARPPGWKLSPRAVRTFICGGDRPAVTRKFFGDDTLVERTIIGLASNRGLLLVGEPGTAKSMLSELLAAAISGTSTNVIQGSAGTTEDQIKYSWNYALLLAEGPTPRALVAAPLHVGMSDGLLVRFEEITRCPPEIQDALVSVLSEKVLAIPELTGPDRILLARPGFNIVATANIRDRGVHEMSSALKRRFNFETVPPIRKIDLEVQLVARECERLLREAEAPLEVDRNVIALLVTAFHDLREGVTAEGTQLEKPTTVMSTAEAVSVSMSAGLDAYYYGERRLTPDRVVRHLAGAVLKDNPDDLQKLKHYFDVVVKQRSKNVGGLWTEFLEAKKWLPLIPPVDLAGRVVYFPVRHHSPACAWHVSRLIRTLKPDAVLIEGPRNATPLIPFLTHAQTRMPVAIYTTYVKRLGSDLPQRHAAYYPLCDYSPELAAIRAAAEVGARARFIDLTFPEMVHAEHTEPDAKARSLLQERFLRHSRMLHRACERAGVRDHDDLWDHLYEVDFQQREPADFMRNVMAYCALARLDYTPEMLAAEGCGVREAAMAAAIADETGRVIVVTGGFHTVALPAAQPQMPSPVTAAPDDAMVVLMRYGFEQLDRLNGYSSGMPAPEFYQRLWEGKDVATIFVELGRLCRHKQGSVSVADEVAALHHARRLALFRGHLLPSREDVLDGIRSVYIKGADDIEGVFVMGLARKLLAGERIGDVPPEAGQPPIVNDFRRSAALLKIDLDRVEGREAVLDIYRKSRARDLSRLFHRLRFLEVPFARWVAGPDFVQGKDLERIQETWKYHWSPATESALIERSLYGATLEEAAAALLLERFAAAQKEGQGRRSDIAALLLLEACRMGLHRHTGDLLARTGQMVAEDASFVSLVQALEGLLVLHVSREPLEAHHLAGVTELAERAYQRACYLLPGLVSTAEVEEKTTLDALNAFAQAGQTLGDIPERRQLRDDRLRELAGITGGNAAVRGAALGLLFGDGQVAPDALITALKGHLLSSRDQGAEGPRFLRGLLYTARTVLWQVPEVLTSLSDFLREWEEDHFIRQLPALRLALADLTPRECDQVARAVAGLVGAAELRITPVSDFTEADLLRGAEVNRRLDELLQQDGLEEFVE